MVSMTGEQRFVPSPSAARRTLVSTNVFALLLMWAYVLVAHRNRGGLMIAGGISAFLIAMMVYVVLRPRPLVTVVLKPESCRLEGERTQEIPLSTVAQAWLDVPTNAINIRHAGGVDAIPLNGFSAETKEQIIGWFKQSLGGRYGTGAFR